MSETMVPLEELEYQRQKNIAQKREIRILLKRQEKMKEVFEEERKEVARLRQRMAEYQRFSDPRELEKLMEEYDAYKSSRLSVESTLEAAGAYEDDDTQIF